MSHGCAACVYCKQTGYVHRQRRPDLGQLSLSSANNAPHGIKWFDFTAEGASSQANIHSLHMVRCLLHRVAQAIYRKFETFVIHSLIMRQQTQKSRTVALLSSSVVTWL